MNLASLQYEYPKSLRQCVPAPWGLGFRPQHGEDLLLWPSRPHLELMVEHFMFQKGGPSLALLQRLRSSGSLSWHGLHLNVGGLDPIDLGYLAEIKRLCVLSSSTIFSDHLAFTKFGQRQSFDLLPIPRTQKSLLHVISRINYIQNFMGFRLDLENISAYLKYPQDDIPELDFLQSLSDATGCGILLDLNNLYVNAYNFKFDAAMALLSLKPDSVVGFHCSGHRQRGIFLHDTHDTPICDAVLILLAKAINLFGPKPIILERDDDDLSLDNLAGEVHRAEQYLREMCHA